MLRSKICRTVLVILFCRAIARADGLIIIEHAPPRPDHFAFAPLEVSFHHVDVEINDRIAVTRVDEEFVNPNSQSLEGTYVFPLPEGATIDKFSMDIDGKPTDAELLDATKARSIYEEIVRKYRDPALLEYSGRGAMKVRIFPIEGHSKKHIQLRYTQVINADTGVTEYSYPLNTEKFSSAALKDVAVKVRVTGNAPIKSIYSPSHDIDIHRDGDRGATVGFEAHNIRPDLDFKLIVTRQPDPIGVNLFTYRSGPTEGYFMLLASPGVDVGASEVQPKDIVFVLDTSGSMAGPKLEQAKKALKFCLANLNSGDRFEIIRFSTQAETLFGELRKVESDKNPGIEAANRFIDGLKPMGGTAIDDALVKALSLKTGENRPFQIVFLTDGQPTVGETREDQIVARVAPGHDGLPNPIRIFPFGIGTDVNTTLLDRIANNTHAISQYVLPEEDIEVKVSNFYSKVQSPMLTNVKIEYPNGMRVSDVYPSAMPDLFKGETLTIFGKYSLSSPVADPTIKVSGTLNGKSVSFSSKIDVQPDIATRNAFIPRLWATRRVGWLLDEIRLHGESKELKDEITQLAREHGIVTPYTAYLIMEDEKRRSVPVASQTMRELNEDRDARQRVAGAYDSVNGSSVRMQRSGDQAVANANSLNDLKTGSQVQAGQQSWAMAKPTSQPGMRGGGLGGGGGGEGYRVAQNYAQQVRVVNGRAFYQNGNTWTDNTAQSNGNLKRQEIKFSSDEYFALLTKYPSAIPWFSLGNEVDVVLDDTLYVIR